MRRFEHNLKHDFKVGDVVEVNEEEPGWNAYNVRGLTATVIKLDGGNLWVRVNPEHHEEVRRRVPDHYRLYLDQFAINRSQARPHPAPPHLPEGCLYGRKLNIDL